MIETVEQIREITERMEWLWGKIGELETCIKFTNLNGPELQLASGDLREHRKEYNELKLKLADAGRIEHREVQQYERYESHH